MIELLITGLVAGVGMSPSATPTVGVREGDGRLRPDQIALAPDDPSSTLPAAATSRGSSGEPAAQADGIQDIVVTAQRRDERLQDVPIAVSALTSEGLAQRGFTNVQELSATVPGLQFGKQGANGAPYIRGVGSLLGNISDEASVATYVDGVYIASPTANFADINSLAVDRIEVLKGPQGTLFGRNATGGIIQIITRDPSSTPEFRANAGYESFATVTGAIYANTPIAEGISMNLSGQIRDQGKGWGRNVFKDEPTYKSDEYSVRGKLKLEPSDRTNITLAADYYRYKSTGPNYQHLPDVPFIDGVPNTLGPYDIRTNGPMALNNETYGASLRIDHDLDALKIESITAYRRARGVLNFDYDQTPLDIVNAYTTARQRNVSQEIHLLSPSDSRIQWLVGGYFYDGKGGNPFFSIAGLASAPFSAINIIASVKTRSYSAFVQATAEILPNTRLTGGFRYTWETQRLRQLYTVDIGPLGPLLTSGQSFEKPTWRIAVDHKFSDDMLGYISYNRGIKSGGFNILAPADVAADGYAPETLDAYEVGLKTELLDRHVRFNTSAFWYEYRDLQVSLVDNARETTANAARARIRGFDAEIQVVSGGLTVNLTGGYLDARYRKYPNALGTFPEGGAFVIDASGNRMLRTPKYTGSAGINYSFSTSIGELTASATAVFSSRFFWSAANRLDQPSYGLLNASLFWESTSGRFNARVWGKNLTDKRYISQGTESGLTDDLLYAAPRTYGLTLGLKL